MINLLQYINPKRPVIRKGTDCYFKDGNTKTNTAIIVLDDGLELINSGFFSDTFFRQYYTDYVMNKYPEGSKLRIDRNTVYKNVKDHTSIITTPLSTIMLKDLNTYFSIKPEYEYIMNNAKSKNIRNKNMFLFNLLTDKINELQSYGYTRIVLQVPLNSKEDVGAGGFWEALQYAWKFGWGAENANGSQIQLLFKFGITKNYTIIPYSMSGKAMPTANRSMFAGIINGGISKAIFKQIDSFDNNGLTNENIDPSKVNTLYLCTNKYSNGVINMSTGTTYLLTKTIQSTIEDVIDRVKSQLVFSPKVMNLGGLLKDNGYSLCEVLSNDTGVKIVNGNAFVITNAIAKEIPFPNMETPKDIISNVLTNKAYGDISEKIVGNSGFNNEDEYTALDNIHVLINDIVEADVNSDKPTALPELLKSINTNNKIKNQLDTIKAQRITTVKAMRNKAMVGEIRDRNKDATVTANGEIVGTVTSILKSIQDEDLAKDIPIETSFDFMKKSVSDNMDTTYAQKYMKPDIIKMVSSFNDERAEPPIFCKSVEFTDSSDELNLKETLDVTFEIPGKKPQRLRLDIPSVSSDGYLYINGTKNFLNKQIITLPIVYIRSGGQDTVAFTTNYNKIFIDRAGLKLNEGLTKLIKAIDVTAAQDKTFARKFKFGNAFNINADMVNTLSHNLFAKEIVSIKCKNNTSYDFDRTSMTKILESVGFDGGKGYPGFKESMIPFGYITDPVSKKPTQIILVSQYDKVMTVNLLTKNASPVEVSDSFYRYMSSVLNNETSTDFNKTMDVTSAGKNFMYSTVKALNNRLPLVLFIAWRIGISGVLDKYNVQYEISKDRKPLNAENDATIQFNDKFLHYKYDVQSGLLLNGIMQLEPRQHSITSYEAKGDAFVDYFINIQKSNLGKGINNFYNEFIDPITAEILESLGTPTELDEALLYCNTMLASSVISKKNDMNNYRLRGTESLTSLIYKIIGTAVRRYRDSAGIVTSNVPLSVKRDVLVKELHSSPVMEQMVLMNPSKEARNRIKATYKGPAGVNMGHARGSEETREYDKSMVGVLSPTTPDSDQAGVTRYLTQNPAIIGKRGIVNLDGIDVEKLNAGNILATNELLSPFTPDRADAPR